MKRHSRTCAAGERYCPRGTSSEHLNLDTSTGAFTSESARHRRVRRPASRREQWNGRRAPVGRREGVQGRRTAGTVFLIISWACVSRLTSPYIRNAGAAAERERCPMSQFTAIIEEGEAM